jgi:predicted CoA-binding protein
MNVAIIGASSKTERYSNKVLKLLLEKDHTVFPVHPHVASIHGIRTYPTLLNISQSIDTIIMYVNPNISTVLNKEILLKSPRRVIFNPGSENEPLEQVLSSHGIIVQHACTLVLLSSGQF